MINCNDAVLSDKQFTVHYQPWLALWTTNLIVGLSHVASPISVSVYKAAGSRTLSLTTLIYFWCCDHKRPL